MRNIERLFEQEQAVCHLKYRRDKSLVTLFLFKQSLYVSVKKNCLKTKRFILKCENDWLKPYIVICKII